jgi:hypothetical protein
MTQRPPARPSRKAAAAGMALLAPTPERLQHGRVVRAQKTVADAQGNIGLPYIAEGTLARLLRRGAITAAQWHAGLRFEELFARAGLDPLRAIDLSGRIPGGDLPHGADRAYRLVHEALDALGGIHSPCGCACWFILGCGMSVQQWATREGWNGRPIRHETATIVLVGALGVLESHFRIAERDCA